eukprot:scaffold158587_cov36-Tisochrysis_lutea.AAC.2
MCATLGLAWGESRGGRSDAHDEDKIRVWGIYVGAQRCGFPQGSLIEVSVLLLANLKWVILDRSFLRECFARR